MIRFATIGTSKITRLFLEAAVQCENFKLVAAYSRNLENAKKFGIEFGAEYFFDSLDEMAESPMIDAVYIATPNSMHYAQALKMLNSGKHVLCEKSMGSNTKEVEIMLQTAKNKNVILLEAMRSIYDPGQRAIKDNLYKLGTIRRATLEFCQYSSRYDAFKAGESTNIFDANLSAGALMDIGVYCVHSLIDLFGKPKSIHASSVLLKNGVDGMGSVLAAYDTMIAELIYSKITYSPAPSQIQGENGIMLISDVPSPRELTILYNDGSREEIAVEACPNNMIYELKTFIDAIEKQKSLDYYNQVSFTAIRIMDQVRKQIGLIFPADIS